MSAWRRAVCLAGILGPALLLPDCGGGSGGGPTAPTPTHTVTITVFYDENGDGTLQAGEVGRVPGVEVEVGGRTALADTLTGRATVAGVPEGSQRVSVHTATLPAYYQAPASAMTLSVPQPPGADAQLALTLPIGSNHPAVYMAFGDSITEGDGAVQHEGGYRGLLEDALRKHFGAGVIVNEALSGSKSDVGAERIGHSLNREEPAYTLIMYGTNDYVRPECQGSSFPCYTIDALRTMVGAAKSVHSLPILATIPPVHPALAQPDRNGWVGRMNDLIRPMARQEGVPLADVYTALNKAGNLEQFFSDRLHPNDRGYEIIAAEFFAAITRPAGASSSAARGPALFLPPGATAGPRG